MMEIASYRGRKRVRGSIYLAIGMSLLAAMVIWVYPSFSASFSGDEFLEAYPPELLALFGIETMDTLAGFLTFELYTFGWVILLGLYLAYLAAGSIADDVDRGRADILLTLPLSRARVVAETYLSFSVPIVVVNVVTPVVIYAGAVAIGETLDVADLLAVHALSIPYLYACAAIGLLASVVVDRAAIAQRLALGVVFGLFMIENLLEGTDYEIVGVISPTHYYDPNAILLESSYDLVDAGILLLGAIGLVAIAQRWFARRDI
ncbi:ABC transporter permease subunit [Halovivax limisalsi]|uniref:ABC transporter permease subunit n=1 Tax=Halovivax limisalsi TaxID=1453760 RepID=UPI001FFDDE26|nr:ABC transporter permease subunit [Halovivax limisalsi]